MFGRRKKQQPDPPPPTPGPVREDLTVRVGPDGADYSDLTTDELTEHAVATGRLAWVHVVSPQFGGMDERMNMVPAPPGAAAALDTVNQQIVACIDAGGSVSLDCQIDYDQGEPPSQVPHAMRYDLGDLGTRVLVFW